MLAVAQDHVADVADPEAVDQDIADLDLLADEGLVLRDLQDIAGAEDEDILLVVAQFTRDLGLGLEMAVFAVHGNGIAGLDQVVDQLDVLLAGMTGGVYVLGDDIRALHQELIDDRRDRLLVARDRAGGEDDRVAGADGDLAVQAVRHAAEGGHALSLAAGRDDDGLFSGIVFELFDVDQGVVGHIEHIEPGRGLDDVDHAPALDDDLAAIFIGVVDDLLDAVHVGGEGRHDDPRVRVVAEDLIDAPADHFLRGCVPRALRVGGVAHEGQDARVAELGEALQVDGIPVDRGVVDLEVSRVHDRARRGGDRQGSRIHDGVVGLDELHIELAELHDVPEGDDVPLRIVQQVVLAELVLDDAHGQAGAVDGHIDLLEDIGEGADVVLVAVGDHKGPDLVDILLQVGRVRNDQVNSQHVILGKSQAAVHDHNAVPVFKCSDVHPDLLESAERDDTKGRRGAVPQSFCSVFQSLSSSGCRL